MKKLILLLLLCFQAALFAADYTEAEYKRAKDLINKKDYASAEAVLSKLVSANPAYLEFRFTLGEMYEARNKFEEAETLYKGITVIDPNSEEAHFALAKLYYKLGRYKDSALSGQNAVKIDPSRAEHFAFLSDVYAKLNDSERAEFYKAKNAEVKSSGAMQMNRIPLKTILVWGTALVVFGYFMFRNTNIAALFALISSIIFFLAHKQVDALIFVLLSSVAGMVSYLKTKKQSAPKAEKQEKQKEIGRKEYDEALKKAYVILGLREDATKGEIKSAFRKLAKKYHPDKTGGDKHGEEVFKAINAAYEIIKRKKLKD